MSDFFPVLKKLTEKYQAFSFFILTAVMAYYCAVNTSVVLDDAFIYFRITENLLTTGKPIFNAGDNSFIATSPLWVFLLALAKALFPHTGLPLIAKLLSIALLGVAAALAYFAFRQEIGKWSVFLGAPFLLSATINSCLGTEIAVLYAAMFGVFWGSLRNQPLWTGLFLGLGYLARSELVLMLLPITTYGATRSVCH